MRTAFWVSVLLLCILAPLAAQAKGLVPLSDGGSILFYTKAAKTRLEIRSARGEIRFNLNLQRDATVSSKVEPRGLKVIAEIEGCAIIFVDSYPSIPGGMSMCQAGEERFLRIISTAQKPASETFRIKLESCRENIELGGTGIEWSPSTSTLHISWLMGPAQKEKPQELSIRIGPDGKPLSEPK